MKALNNKGFDMAKIGVLVISVSNFESFKFSFSSRVCHTVAHELAQVGMRNESQDCFWVDDAPSSIVNLLASDLDVPE